MRQLAHLQTPVLQPDMPKAPRQSRAQRLLAHDAEAVLPLPPAGPGAYLVDWLFEAGPVMHGAMAAQPLTWGEIDAWRRNTGTPLAEWEARTLRRLSQAYAAEARHAEQPDAVAPWAPAAEATPDQRARVSRGLGAMLSAMARPDPRRRS